MPLNTINVYLVAGMLIDAGTPAARRRTLCQLRGRDVSAHTVTHAHPDHFGSSHAVCEALGLPLWTGERDAEAVETARPVSAWGRVPSLLARMMSPGLHGFTVLDVPGHSPGHIALWRESDRTLICGDMFFNFPRLGPPPAFLTVDPGRNRESMRRLRCGLRSCCWPRAAAARSGPVWPTSPDECHHETLERAYELDRIVAR